MESTLPTWLEELQGELAEGTQALLASLGREAFLFLQAHLGLLDARRLAWLTTWGGQSFPEAAEPCLRAGLVAGQEAALRVIVEQNLDRSTYRSLLDALPEKPQEPHWERLRVLAGCPLGSAAQSADCGVRLAIIQRLGEDSANIPEPAKLLEDGDWRVRSGATDALAGFGEAAVETMRALLAHPSLPVQTVASQVLLRCGATLPQ